MSNSIKREIESNSNIVIVCEQCAVTGAEQIERITRTASGIDDSEAECQICAGLKARTTSAAAEVARVTGLPGADKAYRRWEHLSRTLTRHRVKAHNQDARGR